MIGFYAHCLGVFFGSYEEDYGYVTLEVILAVKPVITCNDSGAAVEFVIDQETAFVINPQPEAIAQAIDDLYFHQQSSVAMGMAGLERYRTLNISWDNVLENVL
ncbi:glycosyltransferase [Nostoc sp.]|uniref:glycosyltransferase n=1 Tax=Nostoc sp. TaxID=1180 RepID=UPI002FF9D75C